MSPNRVGTHLQQAHVGGSDRVAGPVGCETVSVDPPARRSVRRWRRVVAAAVVAALTGLLAVLAMPASAVPDPGGTWPAGEVKARHDAEPMPLVELVGGGGVGRLYTTDLDEARSAAAGGMRRESQVVGYLPIGGAIGESRALYRLKPSATATRWLLTSSPEERDSLVAQGWTYEGVLGHVYTARGEGMAQLQRFSNGREWRVALESRHDELLAAGYRFDGGLGYVYPSWVRAGAVMFPMWHEGGHSKESRCEQIYGRLDVWCGVRDFYDGHPLGTDTWPDADFSWLRPSIGYYDDADPQTWERHVANATSAGLSFFNFYWYWDSVGQVEYSSDVGLAAFLQAPNQTDVDFMVTVCAHSYRPLEIPVAQYEQAASTIVEKYLSQPNALRTNDGTKIVGICDPRGLGDGTTADIAAFVARLRTEAREQLGEDIYISMSHPALRGTDVPAVGADGAHCTTDSAGIESQSFSRYLSGQRAFYAQVPANTELMRCVLSGFDERTRYPVQKPDVNTVRYFRDYQKEDFVPAVANLRADMQQAPRFPNVDNFAMVFAWNEWDEGASIEPNERDGCYFLDTLRSGLGLRHGEGCVAPAT